MVSLALHAVSSFTRDLFGACTAISIDRGSVVVGSKDGLLISWLTSTGEELWRASIQGPISDIARGLDRVFVTASSSLYAIDDSEGTVLWKADLEGASDYVLRQGNLIWATSSVYEIEVGDYTESSIWRFNGSGECEKQWTIPERSWFIGLSHGSVILGLGRPRCGILSIKGNELVHVEVGERQPIVCGDYGSPSEEAVAIVGHSNGATTLIGDLYDESEEGFSISSECWTKVVEDPSAVCCILVADGGKESITAYENGFVKSNHGWSYDVQGVVSAMAIGPHRIGESNRSLWVCTGNRVLVLSTSVPRKDSPAETIPCGQLELELSHECRIDKCASEGGTIVLADERGGIHFVNTEFLNRRMEEGSVEMSADSRSSIMRERLRRLRK